MSGQYVRVYYSILDDPRFATVYADDANLAAWLRLLMAADAMYPAPTPLPRWVKPRPMTALVEAGLVELLPGDLYRVHGLATERERRSQPGRIGAAARWSANANALPAQSEANASRAEHSKAEHSSRAPAREEPDDGRLDLEAWLLVKHRVPTDRQRAFLDAYCRTFDLTGPSRAEQLILRNPDDPIAALKADLDAFRRERIEAAKSAERKPDPPKRTGGGLTGINAELSALLAAQYAKEGR
jgi:hypothetical protein